MNVVIQFEASADPLTVQVADAKWVAISAAASDGTGAVTSSAESGSGLSAAWQANVTGYQRIRIRVSTYTSGTVAAAINLSTASARSEGAGGGSGGSITSCTTSGGVAYENGTNNTLTCDANLVWDATNAEATIKTKADANTTVTLPPFSATQTGPMLLAGSPDASFNAFTQNNFLFAGNLGALQANVLNTSTIAAATNTTASNTVMEDHGPDGKFDIVSQETMVSFQTADQASSGVFGTQSNVYIEGTGGVGGATSNQAALVQDAVGAVSGDLFGYQANVDIGAGTAATLTGFEFKPGFASATPVTTVYGFRSHFGAGTAPTTTYGFYADPAVGTTKWSFFSVADPSSFKDIDISSNLLISATAPSVSSGFGTGASVTASNGTAAFRINVGTSNTGTGIIGLPTATTGWNCYATDITTTSTTVSQTKQKATGSDTTHAALQNYTDISGTAVWVDNDVLAVSCFAY
jgi:hypothetical protein